MRYLVCTILILSLLGCKSQKNEKPQHLNIDSVNIEEGCVDKKGISCEVEILKNKAISFKTEESTGKLQKEFVDDENSNVIAFNFQNNPDKAVMDAQYREEIIFEVSKTKAELDLTDDELQNVNLIFGRFCFCDRSQVGYFKINKGHLKIKDGKITIDFDSANIPQVMKSVKATYKVAEN